MEKYLQIGLIITSVALILSVILQSKGAGLGGLRLHPVYGLYIHVPALTFWPIP